MARVFLGLSGVAMYLLAAYLWFDSLGRESVSTAEGIWAMLSVASLVIIGTIAMAMTLWIEPTPSSNSGNFVRGRLD